MAGQIKEFTGVSDPYEEPQAPELVIETDKETLEQSTERLLQALKAAGYLE
jgi:adenylylsulfate kinase